MLDLPILGVEVRVSSRRTSTYAARAAYGFLLLGLFWVFNQAHEQWSAGRLLPNNELARFAAAAFEWLGVGQALIVMTLVPAMVAGSIAEERSRRSLDGLLVSRLSSGGIIKAIVTHPDKGAILLGVLSALVGAYAAIGWVLCRAAIRGFHVAVGRPLVP